MIWNQISLLNASDISTNASAITTKVSKSGDTMTGNLTSTGFIKTGGTSSQFLKADGSVDSSTYLTAESDTLDAVTDRGATTTNSIAVGNVTATSFIKSGGTSAQFLKADGSIDSNAYITAESDTLDSVTDRGAVTTNTVTVGDFNAQASSLNSLSVVTTSSFTGDAAFDTDTLFVDVSADRVGVNTNAPTEALDVVGNVKASGTLAVSGATTLSSTLGVTGAATLSSTLAVTGNLTVDTNTLFVDAANNRVGVGTASPASKIESYVVNTGAIGASNSANIALGSDGALDTRSIMTFGKQINGGYAPAYLGYITTDGAGTSKGDIFLGTRSLTTDSPPAERMRIKSDGDISFRDSSANEAFYWDASAASLGIGTLIPSDKLSVYTTTDYGNNSTYANATIGLGNQTYPVSIRSYRYGGSYLNGLDFYYNNGTPQLGMRIDASGNVGIGVSPAAKLHTSSAATGNVVGALLANSNTSGSADSASLNFGLARNDGFLFNIPAIKFVKNQAWTGTASTVDGYLSFSTINDESVGERMRIDSSGNVGIGTDSIFNPGGSVQKSLELSGSSYSTIYLSANSATVRGQFGADNVNGFVEIGARTNHPFRILTNNTERMRILSSGGLTFNGDTSAANALDDYEEGTFTPTLTASTSNPTVTYDATSTSGRYTKIGNQVTISFEVRWTALSGGSGDVRISNLPFTAFNGNPDGSRMILESYNNTISGLYLTGSVYRNTNYIDIVNNVSGAPFISFTVGGLNTGFALLRGTVTYFVS
jgi:hypothetical protein